MAQEPVVFTLAAAERIAATVLTVERGNRNGGGLQFERVYEDNFPSRSGIFFRMATFTGQWDKNTLKTVTLKYQLATPNTVSASNVFVDLVAATGSTATARNCAIAREGTAWFLIAAEC